MVDPADSINPFPGLATAPPTIAPSTTTNAPRNSSGANKVGWRRVSTRQWVRNFRNYARRFYTLPYKLYFNRFFLTSGYYPDMVDEESYQRYILQFPVTTRRMSDGSEPGYYMGASGTDMSGIDSTTDVSTTSVLPSTETNNNDESRRGSKGGKRKSSGNMAPLAKRKSKEPGIHQTAKSLAMGTERRGSIGKDAPAAVMVVPKKGKKGEEPSASEAEAPAKGKKGKAKDAPAAEGAEAEGGKKEKKGKKAAEGETPAESDAPAGEGAKPKKGKKAAEGETPAASDAPAGEGAKPKKGKKAAEGETPATSDAPAGEAKPKKAPAEKKK